MRETSRPYQYVKVDDLWCCLQQNPAGWLKMWLFQKNVLRRPPFYLDRLLMLRILKRLLMHRLHRLQNTDILELRIFGQLCVPVRRGFKLFDLQRKIVTKLFPSSGNKTLFMEELDQVRKASRLGLAPYIRNWNVRERWYEEDFVSGYPAYAPYTKVDSTFIQRSQPQIVTYLERMILADRPYRITIADYRDELIATLARDLYTQRLALGKLDSIKLFADAMATRLQPMGNHDVGLVFSHGDFSLNNFVIIQERLVPLDWEHASRRTPCTICIGSSCSKCAMSISLPIWRRSLSIRPFSYSIAA
jgi:thiamine kinase-like enzyme